MPHAPRYDLHTHSTESDGVLTPTQLVERAAAFNVDVLALTDHDAVGGLAEAARVAERVGVRLVHGTELSVSWRDLTVHILGLGIDSACPELLEGLRTIRAGREQRGQLMAASLAKAGIAGAFEGAMQYATSEQLLSRTHFARFLVESGHVKEVRDVFKRYLTPGKPGYVEHTWASMADAVGWIRAAGGRSALAHPGRYKVNRAGMRAMLDEFKGYGGDGIEVITSSHTVTQYGEFAEHARRYGFLASCGSDYHGPGESWMELGAIPTLPADLRPIWHDWAPVHAR